MRRGYIDSRRRGSNFLGIAGWVVAALIAATFAWYVIWGPGSASSPAEPTEAVGPTPAPTETQIPSFPTAPPTDTATSMATEEPLPTSTSPPAPTATSEASPTPSAIATAGDEGANVRTGPGTYHELLGRLEPGQAVPITGRYEKWFQVDFGGSSGWVANWVVEATNVDDVPQVEPPVATATVAVEAAPTQVVTPTEETPPPEAPTETPPPDATTPVSPTLTAGADGANVRAGPGTQFEQLGFMEPGETATIKGKYDRWYQIEYNGALAWVANWVVTATGAENVPVVEPPPGTEPTATPGT